MFKAVFYCSLFTLLFWTSSASTRDLVVAFSPYQSPNTAMAQVKTTLKFLTGLEPGDRAIILNGFTLEPLGIFTIPQNKAYTSAKARLGANKKTVGQVLNFAKAARQPQGDREPTTIGALRLPHLLRNIADTLSPKEPVDIIIIGSPHYDDPKEIDLSMRGGLIPTDKNLTLSRADSPYGAADNPQHFQHLRIHHAYGGTDTFLTDQHHFRIQRFWTLYIEAQGGKLVSFTGDLSSVLERVKHGAPALKHHHAPRTSDKFGMIRLRRERASQPISVRPVTGKLHGLSETKNAANVEIGITWNTDCESCDLDLYAALPGKEVLYFGHSKTAEGEHFKDYVDSPKNLNGFETIAFHVPVDLSSLKLAVSFYDGSAPQGVSGEIRLSIGSDTYAHNFRIPATQGVGDTTETFSALETGSVSDSHLILLDPLDIIGLKK